MAFTPPTISIAAGSTNDDNPFPLFLLKYIGEGKNWLIMIVGLDGDVSGRCIHDILKIMTRGTVVINDLFSCQIRDRGVFIAPRRTVLYT